MIKHYEFDDRTKHEIRVDDLVVFNSNLWYDGQESMDRVTNRHGHIYVVTKIIKVCDENGERVSNIETHMINQNKIDAISSDIDGSDIRIIKEKFPEPTTIESVRSTTRGYSYSGIGIRLKINPYASNDGFGNSFTFYAQPNCDVDKWIELNGVSVCHDDVHGCNNEWAKTLREMADALEGK